MNGLRNHQKRARIKTKEISVTQEKKANTSKGDQGRVMISINMDWMGHNVYFDPFFEARI